MDIEGRSQLVAPRARVAPRNSAEGTNGSDLVELRLLSLEAGRSVPARTGHAALSCFDLRSLSEGDQVIRPYPTREHAGTTFDRI